MLRSVLALIAVLACLVSVNGAIVQRDGTPPPTSSSPCPSTTSSTPCPPTTSSSPCPPPTSSSPRPPPTSSSPCPPPTSSSPHPPPTPSSPSPPGTANCNGVQQWQSALAYTAGNEVIYNNELFTALQWTYNNAPSAHPDQWSFGGACAQPLNNQANCQGVSAWQSSTAYNAGSKVTYNNHLWSAVQWVQSNTPGDMSGSWKDLGLCA